MKKEVLIGGILLIAVLIAGFMLLRPQENPNLQIVPLEVETCSQDEYATMVENLPTEGCSTQWVVVCSEKATWKYQCFGGQVEVKDEQQLRAELDEAKKQFFELCQQNPDLECG